MFTPSNLTFAYFFHMACGSTQSPNLVPAFFLSVFTPPPQAAPQRDSEEAEDVKLSSTSEEGAKRNERRGSFGGTETNKNWRFGWLSVAFERFGTLIHSFFFVRDDVYIYTVFIYCIYTWLSWSTWDLCWWVGCDSFNFDSCGMKNSP